MVAPNQRLYVRLGYVSIEGVASEQPQPQIGSGSRARPDDRSVVAERRNLGGVRPQVNETGPRAQTRPQI